MFNVSIMEIRKKQPTSMRFHREVLFLSHFEGNVWGHDHPPRGTVGLYKNRYKPVALDDSFAIYGIIDVWSNRFVLDLIGCCNRSPNG